MRHKTLSTVRTIVVGVILMSAVVMVLRVHQNQEALTPVFVRIEDVTEPPNPSLKTCSQDQRRHVLRETCKLSRDHKGTDNIGLRDSSNLKIMVADDKRKLLYCILAKTGSKSWLAFMISLADKVGPGQWHFRKPEFMKKAGLSYRRYVDVKEMNTKYKDYFKFVVVRHPFQRLASAYYEAILKAGHHNAEGGKAPNFTEFTSRLDSDMTPKLHWSLYQDECQICKVKYDYIIKTETVDSDTRHLKEILGTNVNLTTRHTNFLYEDKRVDPFKYDHMFQEVMAEKPLAMRTALKVYHSDLRTLGYQWDWENQVSICSNDDGKGDYCC